VGDSSVRQTVFGLFNYCSTETLNDIAGKTTLYFTTDEWTMRVAKRVTLKQCLTWECVISSNVEGFSVRRGHVTVHFKQRTVSLSCHRPFGSQACKNASILVNNKLCSNVLNLSHLPYLKMTLYNLLRRFMYEINLFRRFHSFFSG